MPTIPLHVHACIPDGSNPPDMAWTAAYRPYLLFDGTTDELVVFVAGPLPDDYGSAPTFHTKYSMVSATTGVVAIRTEVMAVADGEDIDTDNFSTVEASADDTVPGTAGLMGEISEALTTPTGLAAGDYLAVRFGRENNTSGSNATGDMEVWEASLTYTAS